MSTCSTSSPGIDSLQISAAARGRGRVRLNLLVCPAAARHTAGHTHRTLAGARSFG
uniref:Uncharacterized protein n=1 Tax=Zea mays TaxID=4577 RepID=C0PKS6_MAIZE|nr:unknown [Zea mays]